MYLLQRCVFRQPFLICLYFFILLFLSTFLHLQDRIIYQKLRLFFKTTSNCPLLELNNASYPCSSSSQAMDRGMWTINSRGRLGNQMGQYATLYALAKLNGHQAYILPTMHRYLAPLFRLTLPVIPSEVVNKIPWREYYLHDWMLEEHRHIQGKYVQLTGYPCSFTFYDHIRQEILQEFSFHDHVKAESNRYLLGLQGKRKNVTYIGVHVRRGDYVKRMPNYWRGVVADRGYLQKAMDYFREKYLNPIFVVVSNGMNWCKKNINAARGDVYFVDDRWVSSPGRDFALIAHCNHTIMTIGTFGFWAGYLAGGETVYLANFTLPDSPFLKIFRPSAAFLPGWIGIPADLSPLLPKTPAKSLLSKSSSHNLEQTAGNAC